MLTLGIEGTAHTVSVAIVDNRKILAMRSSMFRTEKGGIRPRDAANHHAENLPILVRETLKDAGIKMKDLELIAFSRGPGLGPCLRTVATAARTIAQKVNIPIIGVNHCLAHVEIAREIYGARDPVFLYVSGGNTQVIAYNKGRYRVFGETLDIGVGNFLDKLARKMGFGFPGGPIIEELAEKGKNYHPLPYSVFGMDVAFSGILTAAESLLRKGIRKEDVAYSVQETVFAMLTEVTERALAHLKKDEVSVGGGVACNSRLKEMLRIMCEDRGASFYPVEKKLAVDNGAMIAILGEKMYKYGYRDEIEDTEVLQDYRIDEVPIRWEVEKRVKEYSEAPGAEAIIEESEYLGLRAIIKKRIRKSYRIEELDEIIRKTRTRREVILSHEAKKVGVKTPFIYDVWDYTIVMEKIEGKTLRERLDSMSEKDRELVIRTLARNIIKMHSNRMFHGDFTTSNVMENGTFIDMSMGGRNATFHDMATDIRLLKECFNSTHPEYTYLFNIFVDEYSKWELSSKVLEELRRIEASRRYI